MNWGRRLRFIGATVVLTVTGITSAWGQTCLKPDRQPATIDLINLVKADPGLATSLRESIELGRKINGDPQTNPVASLDDYYDFIDALVTYDPRNVDTGLERGGIRISMDGKNYCNWNILDMLAYSFFLVDRQITTDPRGQVQFQNEEFSNWMRKVAESWGRYLETPSSAQYVPDFENDPTYGDWFCPTKPYATFQDFFVRELCPDRFPTGSRPVQGYRDPRTVVSIGDSNSMGTWPISETGKIVTDYETIAQGGRFIKGKLYSDVHEFITGEPGETILRQFGDIDPSIFDGGTFTHQFLDVNNYHRLHVPVAGKLVFMRHIKAGTRMKSQWKAAGDGTDVGYYDPRDTADWQFGQTRLVVAIETQDYGVVIAAPMGMAQVSAIQLRDWVQEGTEADKGWEFANFAFGGSDFVVIFERKADFKLTVPLEKSVPPGAGVNYKPSVQGEKYGCFGGVTDCDATPVLPPPYPGYRAKG